MATLSQQAKTEGQELPQSSGQELPQSSEIEGQKQPKLSILVCGKTGSGKSTLTNFILGEDVCEVGDVGEEDGADFSAQTKIVAGHPFYMHGVQVTIYDSPGLQDGTDNDEKYLDDMYEKCRDVNLVYYCHDLTTVRWTRPELKSLQLFTAKFGPAFWDKAIFVLTKANMVQPAKPSVDEKTYFSGVVANNATKLRSEVKKLLEVYQTEACEHPQPDEIQQRVDSIPVVPAGSERVQILPDDKQFIGVLWVNSFDRIPDQYTAEAFMQATNAKERLLTQEEVSRWGYVYGITVDAFKTSGHTLAHPIKKMLQSRQQPPPQPPTSTPPSIPQSTPLSIPQSTPPSIPVPQCTPPSIPPPSPSIPRSTPPPRATTSSEEIKYPILLDDGLLKNLQKTMKRWIGNTTAAMGTLYAWLKERFV